LCVWIVGIALHAKYTNNQKLKNIGKLVLTIPCLFFVMSNTFSTLKVPCIVLSIAAFMLVFIGMFLSMNKGANESNAGDTMVDVGLFFSTLATGLTIGELFVWKYVDNYNIEKREPGPIGAYFDPRTPPPAGTPAPTGNPLRRLFAQKPQKPTAANVEARALEEAHARAAAPSIIEEPPTAANVEATALEEARARAAALPPSNANANTNASANDANAVAAAQARADQLRPKPAPPPPPGLLRRFHDEMREYVANGEPANGAGAPPNPKP
jgi:heme/copper-type cytochrome/quinol oxidase subunit 4